MHDKLAYRNSTAYNWTNVRHRKPNNKILAPKDPINDPNDSDASTLSSESFSQNPDYTRTGKTKGPHKRKQDIENAQLSAPERTPNLSWAQPNARLALGKTPTSQAQMGPMDQVGGAAHHSPSQIPLTPASSQASHPNGNFQKQDRRPAPIFSQQAMDTKKIINMEQMSQKMPIAKQSLKL